MMTYHLILILTTRTFKSITTIYNYARFEPSEIKLRVDRERYERSETAREQFSFAIAHCAYDSGQLLYTNINGMKTNEGTATYTLMTLLIS